MPWDKRNEASIQRATNDQSEEAEALLPPSVEEEVESLPSNSAPPRRIPLPERRQSSISKPPPNGQPRTPRTSNRVRFDIEERMSSERAPNGHPPASSDGSSLNWVEEDDYLSGNTRSSRSSSSTGQRAPLLTDIEAPSVTVAGSDVSFNVEDLLETARPKSGMRSAFMNMANTSESIYIGVD
ncbi:MAG: hypothetical protein Q9191_002308 [Dirinaria sp. TL-2023a]